VIDFTIPGKAQPAGSKRAFPFKRGDGSLGVRVTDANPNAVAWKERVALCAAAAHKKAPFVGAIRLVVAFKMLRPKSHFTGKGLLKQSAPTHPTVKPDATKLVRGLEDACTSILWKDDAQIVEQQVTKNYADIEETRVLVFALSAQTKEGKPFPCGSEAQP